MSNFSTKTRVDYNNYMNSIAWVMKKNEWQFSGRPLECWACGIPMPLDRSGFNFHHRTYKNLGNENLDDLVPLCMYDHEQLTLEWKAMKHIRGHCLHNATYMYIVLNREIRGLSTKSSNPVMKYLGAFHE